MVAFGFREKANKFCIDNVKHEELEKHTRENCVVCPRVQKKKKSLNEMYRSRNHEHNYYGIPLSIEYTMV